jgi:hypothetical protein
MRTAPTAISAWPLRWARGSARGGPAARPRRSARFEMEGDVLARLAPYRRTRHKASHRPGRSLARPPALLASPHGHPLYLVNRCQPGAAGRIKPGPPAVGRKNGWAIRSPGHLDDGGSDAGRRMTYLPGLNPFSAEHDVRRSVALHGDTLSALRAARHAPPKLGRTTIPRPRAPRHPGFPPAPSWSDVGSMTCASRGVPGRRTQRRPDARVRIKPGGEPCRIRPGLEGEIAVLAARTVTSSPRLRTYELGLRKGEDAILHSGRAPASTSRPCRSPRTVPSIAGGEGIR